MTNEEKRILRGAVGLDGDKYTAQSGVFAAESVRKAEGWRERRGEEGADVAGMVGKSCSELFTETMSSWSCGVQSEGTDGHSEYRDYTNIVCMSYKGGRRRGMRGEVGARRGGGGGHLCLTFRKL
jgi:hypothetical protein